MPRKTSVPISDHFATFIEEQVAQERYGSAGEVVTAGLRLLEEQETKLEALRATLIEGEQSGLATPFDVEEFLENMRSRASAE